MNGSSNDVGPIDLSKPIAKPTDRQWVSLMIPRDIHSHGLKRVEKKGSMIYHGGPLKSGTLPGHVITCVGLSPDA